MSQFTFTAEEDALVLSALNYLAEIQIGSHGGVADNLKALLANIAEQQTPNMPVVEMPADVVEPTAEEVEAHFAVEEAPKSKRAKAE